MILWIPAMPFFVQGYADDCRVTGAMGTAKKAFAEAIVWHVVKGFSDVTISDGIRSYSISEFSEAMALQQIAETAI
jgi:hypothetical protein